MFFNKGPAEVSVSDKGHKAIKLNKKEFLTYVHVLPGSDTKAGVGVRWFDTEIAPLLWKANLFSFAPGSDPLGARVELTDGSLARTYVLQVHASNNAELAKRLEDILNIQSELVQVSATEAALSPMKIHENIADAGLLSICAQKEGGLR